MLKNSKKSDEARGLAEKVAELKGQCVAVWCARYCYRGLVREVGQDFLTLFPAFAVENTGQATAEKTNTEDSIPSELTISLWAVEQICQPTWASKDIKDGKVKTARSED